ncbi:MAG: DUF2339 domain-containing protein [Candidatus Acidiferrales bacterium]
MEPGVLFIVLAALALVIAPALAIAAFARVRNLERRGTTFAVDRELQRLELRIQGIEKALARLYEEREAAHKLAVPQPAIEPRFTAPVTQTPVSSPQGASTPRAPLLPTVPPMMQMHPETDATQATGKSQKHFVHPAPETKTSEQAGDLESIVAGRWLNYVGIVAILFAAAFFIEYAFENNWIGAHGRISVGLICGTALLAWSEWLLRSGYKYFSESIAALGAAVLYLSLWGGWHYYAVFSTGEVFGGMIVVTAVITVVALERDSQRLALLALIGGFLTPGLVNTGTDHEIVLFGYVAILSGGVLVLERFRRWNWLPPVAFCAMEIYFGGWYGEFYSAEKLSATMTFAVIFFAVFAALPLMRARRDGRLNEPETFVAISNLTLFLVALRQMLWPQDRWILTLAFLALAAAHLAAQRLMPDASKPGSRAKVAARPLFTGLALVCVSLAVPARLDHQWLTIVWAVEGALLVWTGARNASVRLRGAGLILFAITAMRLIVSSIPANVFLWNERFMTYMIAVACFALGCLFVRDIAAKFGEGERNAFASLAIAANVYALIALSLEIWDFLGRTHGLGIENWLAQQLGLSMLWTLYATLLILIGMARRAAILRWQALTLFAIVAVKVFLYDLSTLSRFYRIVSFLVLGVLLLAVSFLYQRRALTQKEKSL